MFDVRTRLTDPALPSRIRALGFRDLDVANVLAAAATVAARKDDLDAIAFMAEQLVSRIGNFQLIDGSMWSVPQAHSEAVGTGVLPMLTLLLTAPDVAAFHASRGISPEVSTATLADLGQQVWVHRLTYHEFGLHTQGWLLSAWCGALYWLGRLQFELCLENRIANGGRLVNGLFPPISREPDRSSPGSSMSHSLRRLISLPGIFPTIRHEISFA